MPVFRDITPKLRENRNECELYTSYRKTLRQDFKHRCGYCNDIDKRRIRSFTIDHFVPQNPKDFTHNIKPNYYYNLIYSCSYCNLAKSNKYPTKDPKKPHNGTVGFIDPTTEEYTQTFERTQFGKIIAKEQSDLTDHIIENLNLWYPIHERMWKLERVMKLNLDIKEKLRKTKNAEIIKDLKDLHYDLLVEIVDIQENIFVENE